ncbi:unnamed protein product [Mytilus coruscus]|uniref:Zinc finger PHD-type domain-containing protein n=1 Tax=Mytilus coruscus TaxID=42192 RepID=A0A6J8ALA2_MYTCO|nr:unnamed protein product [Mytilus coruscus]
MNEIVKNKITKTTPLVAKVLGKTSNIDHVPAIKYGRAHENTARNLFLALESPKHRNFKVDHCGLFVKADRPCIAASPDGIVSCLCCTKQVLEIKCPFSLANKSVVDGWNNLDNLQMNESTQRLELNLSHSYYTQMQAQMAVTGLKMGHFFVWSPKESFQTKVQFDPIYRVNLQEQLTIFFKAYVVPYLLCNKQLCVCPKCDKVCCEIEEISYQLESSVLCECCDLWYHWKCVGIKNNPTIETWVCSSCLLNALDM